jgi:hypothetical protein
MENSERSCGAAPDHGAMRGRLARIDRVVAYVSLVTAEPSELSAGPVRSPGSLYGSEFIDTCWLGSDFPSRRLHVLRA